MVPIYTTSITTPNVVTVTFPNHGQTVGSLWEIINPTVVANLTLVNSYVVQTVANSYTFTILSATPATSIASQYQNAAPITSSTSTGTTVTIHFSTTVYTNTFSGNPGNRILVGGGKFTEVSGSPGTIVITDSGPALTGLSFAPLGGFVGLIYNFLHRHYPLRQPHPCQEHSGH